MHTHTLQVMEKLNEAIEKLFECERLPEDPIQWIADYTTKKNKSKQRPSSGTGRS